MQGAEGHDEVPVADVESISRRPTTGFPPDGERAYQSRSFGFGTSETSDPQARHDYNEGDRDPKPEVRLTILYPRMPLKRFQFTHGQHIPKPNIQALDPCSLPHILEVNERRYDLFSRAQSANSVQRIEFQHRLDNFQYILCRLQNSVKALTSGVTGGKSEVAPKRPKGRLTKLESQLHNDVEELTQHIQSTAMLMSRMREGDRKIEEVGNHLRNSLQAMSTTVRRNESGQDDGGLMHTSVSLLPTSSRSRESHAARPPMVEELAKFCDAVADSKIMRERIDELYLEKHEQEIRRDFLGDQGLKLDKASEKYLLTWHQSLANANLDLQEAEAAVSHARKVCDDANVSIPPWADTYPALSEVYQEYKTPAQLATNNLPENGILQRLSNPEVGSSMNGSERVLIDASSLMFNPLNDQPSFGDKIANWIKGVELDVTDPSSGFPSPPVPENILSTIQYRFAQLRNPQS